MSAIPYAHNKTSRQSSTTSTAHQHRTPNVWFDDPQHAILQQTKKHTMGPAGYGRIRVPARYYAPVDRGPNTFAVIKRAVATNNALALSQELLKYFDSVSGYQRAFIVAVLRSPLSSTPPSDVDLCIVSANEDTGNSNNSNDIDTNHGLPFAAGHDHMSPNVTTSSSSSMHTTYSSGSNSSTHLTSTTLRAMTINSPPTSPPKSQSESETDLTPRCDDNPIDWRVSGALLAEAPCLLNFTDSPDDTQFKLADIPHDNAIINGGPFKAADTNSNIACIDIIEFQPSPPTTNSNHLGSASIAPIPKTTAPTNTYPTFPPLSIDPLDRHFIEQHILYSQKVNREIQPRHQQELLNAILAQEHPLQIFLAIDTFDLEPILLTPLFDISAHELLVDEGSNPNYASLLAIQLIEHGYSDEATSLLLRCPSGRSNPIDVKLLTGLVAQNKLKLLFTVIGDNKDFCRSALHAIEQRVAAQIWTWVKDGIIEAAQLDHFHVVQCMNTASTLASTATFNKIVDADSSTAFSTILELAETATNLSVEFGLDNTMKTLQSVRFIMDLCTVCSLLPLQHNQPLRSPPTTPSEPSVSSFSYFQLKPRPTTAAIGEDLSLPPLCGTDYHLMRPWRYLPAVLPILRGNGALQRLVIWYGVRNQLSAGTSSATGYLAYKLGLLPFFNRCLQVAERRHVDSLNFSHRPKTLSVEEQECNRP
ncbi:hypothetical protein BGX24_001869 [Mortierella sp. AD032]|nr:hypothetical protein BGX24_001869 [Mortierella sp. AD032]